MTTTPVGPDRDLLERVRRTCDTSGRETTQAEAVQALEALEAAELATLDRLLRAGLDAKPLSPFALVDIVRGTTPALAATRESVGYYTMVAERDAFAVMARKPSRVTAIVPEPEPEDEPDPVQVAEIVDEKPIRVRVKNPPPEEVQALVTLFAYHRDPVRVAQEMGIGLSELNERVESLGMRRKIHRLLEMTTDIDVFLPSSTPRNGAMPAPVVRKKADITADVADDEEAVDDDGDDVTGPAAQTKPVNEHGTRVFRRNPAPAAPPEPAPGVLISRREYVRESKRKQRAKVAAPARPDRPAAPPAPPRSSFTQLQGTPGRGVLERLLAEEKANPRVLVVKLSERFDGPAGRPITEADLRQLLTHHGLAADFAEKETANARFLIGFHQGARAKLCNALLVAAGELDATLQRYGLSAELERVRAERSRLELGRKKMNDRVAQVLSRAPYLDDLGILPIIDREVRDHLSAQLGTTPEPAKHDALRAELGLEPNAYNKLLRRYELGGVIAPTP